MIGLINMLKGLAIIAVFVIHWAITFNIELGFFGVLMSPVMYVFMAIMGFNLANSWEKNSNLKNYFRKKFLRFFPVFIVAFIGIAILGMALGIPLQFGLPQLAGYFPITGIGNYFIFIIVQAIVLFPLIIRVFKKHPMALGIVFILANAVFVVSRNYVPLVNEIYRPCIIRFLAPLWLGMLAAKKTSWFKKHDVKFWPLELIGKWSYELYVLQVIIFSAIGHKLIWQFFPRGA